MLLISRLGRVPIQIPVLIVALALVAWSIYRWQVDIHGDPNHLVVSGSVEGKDVSVGSKVGGRLLAIHVLEGDEVAPGDLIAEFDVPELIAQREQLLALEDEASAIQAKLLAGPRAQEIAQAKASLDAAQAQLSELEQGTRTEDIAATKAYWQAAEVEYNLSVADLERAQQLFDSDVLPRNQLDQAQAQTARLRQAADAAYEQYTKAQAGPRETQLDAAQAYVDAARAAYELLLSGTRHEDIAAAASRVTGIEAQLAALDVSLAEARVVAPAAGVVLAVHHQPGDLVAPAAPVCTQLLPETYFVQVFIPEDKLAWTQPGTTTGLTVDAYPGEVFHGSVTYLAEQGEFTPRNLQTKEKRVEEVFRCEVKVEGTNGKLRPGMVCDVTFTRPGAGGST